MADADRDLGHRTRDQYALPARAARAVRTRRHPGDRRWATECMFGQQWDEKRTWVPNYDLYCFEVETTSEVKMLHEMQAARTQLWGDGEHGGLDAGADAIQERGFDPCVICTARRRTCRAAVLSLHRPGEVVDAAALCVG
jgi:hypothetical protein